MTRNVKIHKFFALIFISLFLTNCTAVNHTKTDKKILDYESSGSALNALSLGVPGAAILFLAVDINNYKKFNLNGAFNNRSEFFISHPTVIRFVCGPS